MVVHTCNSSPQEPETGGLLLLSYYYYRRFEVSLGCIECRKPVRATESAPVSDKTKPPGLEKATQTSCFDTFLLNRFNNAYFLKKASKMAQ